MERFFDPRRAAELLDPQNRQEPPEGLAEARAAAESMLAALREESGLGPERFLLGGFSQGAMLACELGLLADVPPAAMVLWSPMPIHLAAWSPAARDRASLPVFQSHGRSDDVIPYRLGEELYELLDNSGVDVTFVPFDGPHGIGPEVMLAFLEWIDGVLAGAEPSRG